MSDTEKSVEEAADAGAEVKAEEVEGSVDSDAGGEDSSQVNLPVKPFEWPAIPPAEGYTEDDIVVFGKERDCMVLLLEARKLLERIVSGKEELDKAAWAEKRRLEDEEKKRTGDLSVQEIQAMLQSQQDEDEIDLVAGNFSTACR